MNTTNQTAALKGDKHMNTNRQGEGFVRGGK